MRFAGSQLQLNLNELSPEDAERFAGEVSKRTPEVTDRIKATISLDIPDTDGID
jgi:hypothetical protein